MLFVVKNLSYMWMEKLHSTATWALSVQGSAFNIYILEFFFLKQRGIKYKFKHYTHLSAHVVESMLIKTISSTCQALFTLIQEMNMVSALTPVLCTLLNGRGQSKFTSPHVRGVFRRETLRGHYSSPGLGGTRRALHNKKASVHPMRLFSHSKYRIHTKTEKPTHPLFPPDGDGNYIHSSRHNLNNTLGC